MREDMSPLRTVLATVLPLAALGLVLYLFFAGGLVEPLGEAPAPIEVLSIERITFAPDDIGVFVRNAGPDPVTIAQVLVNEAMWTEQASFRPGRSLGRLDATEIHLGYDWEVGQPYTITLVSETGIRTEATVDVARETPVPNARYLGTFALLGAYVGVVPVFLGIVWLPALRRLGPRGISAILAFTVGLLVFLGVDAVAEALEIAGELPGAYQGEGLVAIGVLGTILILMAVGRRKSGGAAREQSPLAVAYLIALGIGLHNLGEGLAISAAYTAGELALGAGLVVGFTIHNTTEGLAIVSPILRSRAGLLHLGLLGALAGVPTIAGTWIGGFAGNPALTVLFLAIGAGAVLQVVYAIGARMARSEAAPPLAWGNVAGFVGGLAAMYATGLLIPV
jgi:zinc transporter ZupT